MADAREGDVSLERDGHGCWRVNGAARADLDGCLDVGLESSACTNAIPVHRLQLGSGDEAESPAVHVRALDLAVERLEQRYGRVHADRGHQACEYHAPAFDFECRLIYDESGLVLDYPGIATRARWLDVRADQQSPR